MKYYSTNKQVPLSSLKDAVLKGLADDNGLYMPEQIPQLSKEFFATIQTKTLQEISLEVATALFGEDVDASSLRSIVYDTLSFDIPLVKVTDDIYSLELFHGPTLAFKDVGARFLSRMMQHFTRDEPEQSGARRSQKREANVLVATSGDTGSAVANGFLGVDGIMVTVLYPKGLVSKIQESQFTTLGKNVRALEVDGTFDDCQRLVKQAFLDKELNRRLTLTSANSINLARFIPQAFYYFWGYAQMPKDSEVVASVPSGNFGNLMAGLLAKRMGLPIKHFVAANNANDVFLKYLQTASFSPRPSIATIANAMDVGNPSNFARIMDLYNGDHAKVVADISGYRYGDAQIAEVMKRVFTEVKYMLDPHGACAYEGLREQLQSDKPAKGFFIETAHPAKFKETVDEILGADIAIPEKLQAFMKGQKQTIPMSACFEDFKTYLLG
ncbi:MAG: threonine synthase [Prevotellaceae bacterium]|jgi:threonine synthase|nr:threonine synthase [Prevotellaceae bacterium]